MSDWGKGVNNNIGWGQGANNDIGWGSIYADSNSGLTLLLKDKTAFIIEVDTSKAGSASDAFEFTGAEGDYDVIAKQNGTQVATFNDLSGEQTITLPSSGIYVLEVIPKEVNGFNRIAFDNGGDKDKIIDIKQWGEVAWSSFNAAFRGCSNMLTTATDIPNLSNVTDMRNMFRDATSANPDTSNWDVSNVTDMSSMFNNATSANPDVSNWDVSSVTDISFMFYRAPANPDVSNWNVSSVTDMSYMFLRAPSANPDVSNWDVSNVTSMRQMFYFAPLANPDVSNWDVSSVTDMSFMFYRASSANPDVSNWNVSSVTSVTSMLENSNLSEENLTSIYENWSQLNLQQNVAFSAGNTKYNASGQAGRDILVNTYNWLITDGGQV